MPIKCDYCGERARGLVSSGPRHSRRFTCEKESCRNLGRQGASYNNKQDRLVNLTYDEALKIIWKGE